MTYSSDPSESLREYPEQVEVTLDFEAGQFEDDQTVIIPGQVEGGKIQMVCRPEAILLTHVQEGVLALTEGESVAFKASQGRGSGTVTQVIESDSAPMTRRVLLDSDEEDVLFALVHNGPDRNATAEVGEYIPEDNAYDWFPVGAITSLSEA